MNGGHAWITLRSCEALIRCISSAKSFIFEVFQKNGEEQVEEDILSKDLQSYEEHGSRTTQPDVESVHNCVPVITNKNDEDSHESSKESVKILSGTRAVFPINVAVAIYSNLKSEELKP